MEATGPVEKPAAPADGEAGSGETDYCADPNAECCTNADCSDRIYCNGIEECVEGQCESGDPPECDDGLACTEDLCDERAKDCHFQPRDDRCDDQNLCNGTEKCMPALREADEEGCVQGMPMVCDDDDECTEDACEANECRFTLRDRDNDGHGDRSCQVCDGDDCVRGDDCDDNDPEVFPGASEICDDGKDNNCDHDRDYGDPTCVVPNDSCIDALELRHSQQTNSSTRTTTADIADGCAPDRAADAAFAVVVTEESDVVAHVESRGRATVHVALSADCDRPAATLACEQAGDEALHWRGLLPGTYYVIVSAATEVDFSIRVDQTPAEPPLPGDVCDSAEPLVPDGTAQRVSFVEARQDYSLGCLEDSSMRDIVLEVTVDDEQSLSLAAALADASGTVGLAVQRHCGLSRTELGCWVADDGLEATLRHVLPGTYSIVVAHNGDAELDVSALAGPLDPNTHLVENFSYDGGHWNLNGPWEVGVPSNSGGEPRPHAGACLATNLGGAYPTNMGYGRDYAQTPPIDLQAALDPVLSFRTWFNTRAGSGGGHLEISSDGGATFTLFNPEDLTPAYNETNLGNSSAWSGNGGGWLDVTASLADYAGHTIILRFAMFSYSWGSVSEAGWYVDDIVVEERPEEEPEPEGPPETEEDPEVEVEEPTVEEPLEEEPTEEEADGAA
jgi:hypothetical protein